MSLPDCTCLPHTYAPARPVRHLSEVAVIDPTCPRHQEVTA